jgi:hypothetical protein
MKMMRDNPSIMASAQKLMENMSPAELQASSKVIKNWVVWLCSGSKALVCSRANPPHALLLSRRRKILCVCSLPKNRWQR